ncbi:MULTISPECIES: hypothetical protein [Phenylobacterium]|uniref:Membrane protein CcdC involved in cytochrome C biogenesis n=1 Tax=Phenylobacterium koreense TaxID=266125 RepID=A0ABV2EK93_9CAUL
MIGGGDPQGAWTYVAPMIAIIVIVLRGVRTRKLRIERMWIMPALILLVVGITLGLQPPRRFAVLVAEVFALGVGLGMGWWRGRTTNIMIDAATHELTSRSSPIGMALIASLFLIRFALKDYATLHARELHVAAGDIAEVFLLMAAGLICAQRLEMWIRARRLLAQARAAP